MDIAQFIANFIYRIRYWLLWGTLIITGIVIYFTQFLPFSYTVEGSLYAGVTRSEERRVGKEGGPRWSR